MFRNKLKIAAYLGTSIVAFFTLKKINERATEIRELREREIPIHLTFHIKKSNLNELGRCNAKYTLYEVHSTPKADYHSYGSIYNTDTFIKSCLQSCDVAQEELTKLIETEKQNKSWSFDVTRLSILDKSGNKVLLKKKRELQDDRENNYRYGTSSLFKAVEAINEGDQLINRIAAEDELNVRRTHRFI